MKRTAPGLSDHLLVRELERVIANEDAATAIVLDHIAEYDARQLYRAAGYSSMFTYCVGRLRRSEEAAYKRIRAARAAQRFPVLLDAVAENRLHLTGVVLLAPHLTEDTAGELISAATHKTAAEIQQLLAERFPRPDLPTAILPIPAPAPAAPLERTSRSVEEARPCGAELALRPVGMTSPEYVPAPSLPAPVENPPTLRPLALGRFALRCTIDQETHDALRYAQELLSHELPSGDEAQVLKLALGALIPQLEKRRFSATVRPRRRPGCRSQNPRSVPADIQRAVWARDGAQCTFVGDDGHRCQERKFVELDHVEAVARGGGATKSNLRLLCRAHNQLEAERVFGAGFMRQKLEAARSGET